MKKTVVTALLLSLCASAHAFSLRPAEEDEACQPSEQPVKSPTGKIAACFYPDNPVEGEYAFVIEGGGKFKWKGRLDAKTPNNSLLLCNGNDCREDNPKLTIGFNVTGTYCKKGEFFFGTTQYISEENIDTADGPLPHDLIFNDGNCLEAPAPKTARAYKDVRSVGEPDKSYRVLIERKNP